MRSNIERERLRKLFDKGMDFMKRGISEDGDKSIRCSMSEKDN